MGNDTSEKWGEMREVVTDSGLFYYQIEKSTTFDYLHLFTKKQKGQVLNYLEKSLI
jgi:hypothetical protein